MTMWVFGYGSLINYDAQIKYPVIISGLKRSWHVRGESQKQTYLGVQDNKDFQCNGVVIKVTLLELEEIIKREEYYINIPISRDRINRNFSNTDIIYCFYSNNFNKPTIEYPICKKYIKECIQGCKQYGSDFVKEFFYTTYHWGNNFV